MRNRNIPPDSPTLPCSKCGIWKPKVDFALNSCSKRGYESACRACKAADHQRRRQSMPEWYERQRKEQRAKYPERFIERARQHATRYPKARYAREVTRNEVKAGRLVRQSCETCGQVEYVTAHHDDYDQPLVVRWLCRSHHRLWHEANGHGANIEGEPVRVTPARLRGSPVKTTTEEPGKTGTNGSL